MPRIVSSIKKHITTTEFWRALSFVLKRLESIAKYLTTLPLPFTLSLYILHLVRAGLRIFSFFYKTKNKNLGDTCKLLFALFKVSIAIIAIVLLGCGLVSLPTVLLTAFFAYNILKLIHSSIIFLASTVSYLKIDKNCIEQQWMRAQYRDNITKHVAMLGAGLLFMLLICMLSAGASILIWTHPLLLLADAAICLAFIASAGYLTYKMRKNKRTTGETSFLKKDQTAKIKKFLLLYGLGIVALLIAAVTPSLGLAVIPLALILLSAQDALLTIYYYFYGVDIPSPEPAHLNEEQLNASILQKNRDYYQTLSPILYLQTQVTEKLPHPEDVSKANKKILLKVALVKLLQLENKLEKISQLGSVGRFFSPQKKLKIKKEYLLYELACTLNTDNKEVLIDLFIQAIIDLPSSKRAAVLENNLSKLLEYRNILSIPELNKNLLAQLVLIAQQFKAQQREYPEQTEVVKPKAFYQSFWKKVGACQALSEACQATRTIEESLTLSNKSWGFCAD